jgi:hypothetical protein
MDKLSGAARGADRKLIGDLNSPVALTANTKYWLTITLPGNATNFNMYGNNGQAGYAPDDSRQVSVWASNNSAPLAWTTYPVGGGWCPNAVWTCVSHNNNGDCMSSEWVCPRICAPIHHFALMTCTCAPRSAPLPGFPASLPYLRAVLVTRNVTENGHHCLYLLFYQQAPSLWSVSTRSSPTTRSKARSNYACYDSELSRRTSGPITRASSHCGTRGLQQVHGRRRESGV